MRKGQRMPEWLKQKHSETMKGRYNGKNNPFYGKKHTNETKQKMRNNKTKKDNPTYGALHDYIKYHLTKPLNCNNCGEEKKLDLANISQEYKRDLNDWEWLCRKCHMIKDGRMFNLIMRNRG